MTWNVDANNTHIHHSIANIPFPADTQITPPSNEEQQHSPAAAEKQPQLDECSWPALKAQDSSPGSLPLLQKVS